MNEKNIYKEILEIQNSITDLYNSYIKLSHTKEIREELLKILNMEHKICEDVFESGEKKGYFTKDTASQKEINKITNNIRN